MTLPQVTEIKIPCLDKGYVRWKTSWMMCGTIDISNDARVSFDVEKSALTKEDFSLIDYLGNEKHTAPFRSVVFKTENYVPLMIARQHWKYIIGSQHEEELQSDEYVKYQDQFTSWNETSRRYIKEKIEFFYPTADKLYLAPENRKQGHGDIVPPHLAAQFLQRLEAGYNRGVEDYLWAVENGFCIEQARLLLGGVYGLMIRYRWTCSLQTMCHMLNQRVKENSQSEWEAYTHGFYQVVCAALEYGHSKLLDSKVQELLAEVQTRKKHTVQLIRPQITHPVQYWDVGKSGPDESVHMDFC